MNQLFLTSKIRKNLKLTLKRFAKKIDENWRNLNKNWLFNFWFVFEFLLIFFFLDLQFNHSTNYFEWANEFCSTRRKIDRNCKTTQILSHFGDRCRRSSFKRKPQQASHRNGLALSSVHNHVSHFITKFFFITKSFYQQIFLSLNHFITKFFLSPNFFYHQN